MDLKVNLVKVGPERTNCYIVSARNDYLVVDPGADAEKILELIPAGAKLHYILLTHGHFDHVGGVDGIKSKFPDTPVMLSEEDVKLYEEVPEQGVFVGQILKKPKAELEAIRGGEFLPLAEDEIEVIATPGHTPGGVCYRIDKYLFTGDTLFYHTIGRTDLPFSDENEMRVSLDLLAHLDRKLVVYPGHGRESTICEEIKNNPYL